MSALAQMSLHGSYRILPGQALRIGSRRQLAFMDDLIEDWWSCRRTVHQPVKHPANPLIKVSQPWEGGGPMGGHHNPRSGNRAIPLVVFCRVSG